MLFLSTTYCTINAISTESVGSVRLPYELYKGQFLLKMAVPISVVKFSHPVCTGRVNNRIIFVSRKKSFREYSDYLVYLSTTNQ